MTTSLKRQNASEPSQGGRTITIPDFQKLSTHPNFKQFVVMAETMGIKLEEVAAMDLDGQVKVLFFLHLQSCTHQIFLTSHILKVYYSKTTFLITLKFLRSLSCYKVSHRPSSEMFKSFLLIGSVSYAILIFFVKSKAMLIFLLKKLCTQS